MITQIHHGDSFEVLRKLPDRCLGAVVTDPPYGLHYLGYDWDAPWKSYDLKDPKRAFELWAHDWMTECFRLLRPGGLIKVFGGSRTFHRFGRAVAEAGFTGLHQEAWTYGMNIPRGLNVARVLEGDLGVLFAGFHTVLKPCWEPILVGKKPLEGP